MPRLFEMLMLFGVLLGCHPEKGAAGIQLNAAGDLSEEDKAKVLARINSRTITLDEFERRLNQQSPFVRSRYSSLQRKKEFLKGLLRFELLAMAAKEQGLDQDPEILLVQKQAMVRRLSQEIIKKRLKPEEISAAEIEAYYTAQASKYQRPLSLRCAHILYPDEASALKALKALRREILEQPSQAERLFSQRAKSESLDKGSAQRGGDLGFLSKQKSSAPAPLLKALFELELDGDLGGAIESEQGWHLIQRRGTRLPSSTPLVEASPSIRNLLYRQKKAAVMEEFVQKLREKAQIKIDESVLQKARAQAPKGPSFAPPGLRIQ